MDGEFDAMTVGPDPMCPVMASTSTLKMAPFGVNSTCGVTPTMGEGSIAKLEWTKRVAIARAAETAGLEAVIPGARWRGYEGESGWCPESYEGIPWAAGIGEATERIQVFSTIHLPLLHPLRVAKEMATVDHVSAGRCAINVVAGWNVDEFAMFGLVQNEHDDRYAQAKESITILKCLWVEHDEFDFDGRYYQLKSAYTAPEPVRARPGGSSPPRTPTSASSPPWTWTAYADRIGHPRTCRPRRSHRPGVDNHVRRVR